MKEQQKQKSEYMLNMCEIDCAFKSKGIYIKSKQFSRVCKLYKIFGKELLLKVIKNIPDKVDKSDVKSILNYCMGFLKKEAGKQDKDISIIDFTINKLEV